MPLPVSVHLLATEESPEQVSPSTVLIICCGKFIYNVILQSDLSFSILQVGIS
jgi:hypothetical protein